MHKTIAPGIYEDQYGIKGCVDCAAGRKSKRFPKGTSLRVINRWRNETKTKLQFLAMRTAPVITRIPMLPRGLDGWCFLYVVAGARSVKIGRTLNPRMRLHELQTGHDEKLELLVAVPTHASLEPALHRRFAAARSFGEWV